MSDNAGIPVLLMECFLAGFQYHEAARYWDHLPIGEEAALVREPGNPYDPRAVRVDWLGASLGYIPREANFTVAQMLDRDEEVHVRIAGKRPGGDPRTRILLEIFVMANPAVGLPTLYDTTPEDAKPELREEKPRSSHALVDPPPPYHVPAPKPDEAIDNKLIRGLAWMLAGRVIGKAKGGAAKR